jgi:CheY-like chemotaxis protein
MTQPPPRLLIVNSNPDIRKVLAAVLTNEGFGVATAKDGTSALVTIATGDFSVIVIGKNLPDKNLPHNDYGMEIVRRGRIHHPKLKALYLADYLDFSCGDPDLDSCLAAPFKLREIVGCIWELHHRDLRQNTITAPRLDVELGGPIAPKLAHVQALSLIMEASTLATEALAGAIPSTRVRRKRRGATHRRPQRLVPPIPI